MQNNQNNDDPEYEDEYGENNDLENQENYSENYQSEEEYNNENYQEDYYDEIPHEPVENIDLSEAIIQDASYDIEHSSDINTLTESGEEVYLEEQYDQEYYEEDDYEEIENYIEIDEDHVFTFSDWVYDAIINKTLKEVELNYDYEFIELLNDAKRGANGFLSLSHLESRDFRVLWRYMTKAYKNSYTQEKRIYTRKAHNQFLKIMHNLMDEMVKDPRYTMF